VTTLDADVSKVAWNADGLAPVVVQQFDTLEVLMLAWMDAEALRRTLTGGRAGYWSRSRQEHRRKGATPGNTPKGPPLAGDCGGDTTLLTVDQHGPACHTGTRTCFDGRGLTVAESE